jgi:hypothetical protein
MNKIASIFTEDWVRKVLAIFFAFVLWFDVQGRIAVDREIKLDVTTLSQQSLGANNFTLRIKSPDGWKLTSPVSGDTISIWLRGSSNELQDFTARQCAASIDVHFDADETQHRIDFSVSPSDLDWLRPGDAQYLLDRVNRAQPLQELTFERVTEAVHVLDALDINVVGSPATTHLVDISNTRFVNHSQVNLSGPKFAMDRLLIDLANAGDKQASGLLSPLQAVSTTRQDIHSRLHLADEWRKAGIRMNPPQIDVSVPVRLAQTASHVWLPNANELQILDASDNAGQWQVLPWEPTQWIAEMPEVSATDVTLNAQWVRDHIIFVLSMNSLSIDSLDKSSLKVQAILSGFDSESELLYFQKNLHVRALQPEDAMVSVIRIQ